ncbi:hypothetical protein DUK53_09625 [Listeria sp. SHR_NRA_18]|nr:hypothetical protein EP56_17170 [Listeriaceae bacterium FSL A5-0209]RQW66876.1 hypothetical protein DUK53_09625 [Listeria sp. SHR_NRA_18]
MLFKLEKLKEPVSSEKNWSGRKKNLYLVFVEGVKFSRIWLKGRQFHFIQLHIEVLKKQTTLF